MRALTGLVLLCVLAPVAGCGQLPSPGPVPPGKSFEGVWDTNWGQLELTQRGSHVHGTYKGFRNGSVSGDADGNLFIFRWTQMESQQWGRGYLQMTPGGDRLHGKWGYRKDYTNGGSWWANRALNR